MKLIYKFLLALLLISIIPLIIYSIILLNTTAITLKNVINQNITHTVNNASREVNKFVLELERKLDIARQIEQAKNLPDARKSTILFQEMSTTKLLFGLFLLDNNYKTLTGLTSSDIPSQILFDKELIEKTNNTRKVEMSNFRYMIGDKPYFDIVYPLDIQPKQYLYYRVKIDRITELLSPYIKGKDNTASRTILIIDDFGSSISIPQSSIRNFNTEQIQRFFKMKNGTMFIEDKKVNFIQMTGGLGWLILYQELESDAYSAITRIKILAGGLVLFTFWLSVLGAILLARNLTKPIQTLISGIETVAGGNLDYKVPRVSSDELAKLATIFNEMTAKLKKLQDDIKKSERLSAIGQMANILGHEIRNPLGAITNASYLIRMEMGKLVGPENKVFNRLEIIDKEIKSTNKIINDMLDFSRTRPPVLTKKDFNEVIKTIIEETKIPEGIELQEEFPEIPQVPIDIEEIKQVIRNLVNNAIDSMSESKTKRLALITSKSHVLVKNTEIPAICLKISDTGCGIPRELLEKIFEPFFSTKSKGTGLGLAVVSKIIKERHKGIIEIESEKGVGTSFLIYLPVNPTDK